MKWWLVQMLLLAPEDAGGGAPAGGAPDAGADAGVGGGEDTGTEAGVEDGASAPGADAGDDDDADDDVEAQFSEASYREDPNFKRVLAKLKKQNRQLARMRPVMSRIKDVNLDDVMSQAASANQLRQVLAAHPDLAEEVLKAVSGTRKRAGDAAPAKFDANSLPFSVEDESGKFFASFYERFLALEQELKDAKQELSSVRESGREAKAVAERLQWKAAVKAAAAKVPDWARDMFNDAVYGAYAEASRRGTQLDSQRVINHYLSKLPIGNKAQAAARAAAAQRIAGSNSNLPRVPNGSGVPAGARKKGETVADVNRRLRNTGFFAR